MKFEKEKIRSSKKPEKKEELQMLRQQPAKDIYQQAIRLIAGELPEEEITDEVQAARMDILTGKWMETRK